MVRSPSASEEPVADGVVAVLPDDVINQIAAGEVVERPASVVKELIDNAIDAGATLITVECEGGGKARIRVTDDGCGMSPADAQRCFARHATSKIRSVDDLHKLATMGFRGEAMSSIASVSRTVLTTRRAADLAATRVVVEHGRIVSVAEVGSAPGTSVEVSELFGNLPARLKFLKGEPTEASHVTDAVTRLAMAHPALHVRLRQNGRAVIDVPPDRDGLSRASALVGARLGQRLHSVFGQEQGITVEAFLAAPDLAQTTARGVQLFVGRRAVRDRGLLHAVAMGYGELVPRGRYPVAIVHVQAPAGTVDFNVHPQKAEVRFSDASAVAAAVRHVVRAGVGGAPWLQESASAATIHMTVRTQMPAAGQGRDPGELATSLAHRYAARLAQPAPPERPQLRFDQPPAYPPVTAENSRAAEGAPRWYSAVRAVEAQRRHPADSGDPNAGRDEGSDAARDVDRHAAGDDDGFARLRPSGAVLRSAVAAESTRDLAAASLALSEPLDGESSLGVSRADDQDGRASATPASFAAARSLPQDEAPRWRAPSRLSGSPAAPLAPPPIAVPAAASTAAPDPAAPLGFFSSLRYLGQLQLTYLICEAADELVLIDQHAAHERVEFQRLMERRQNRQDIATQRLLFPSTIEVSPSHVALAEEVAPLWAQLGYEIEPFGKSAIAVKSVPAGMRGADPSQVLRDLLDDWLEAGASRAVESRLENMLATIACHCAVRAGDRLSSHEVEALLCSMDQVDFRTHCPHGRPVLLRMSIDEIARRFGR
jgi:DNA mismatch repair protein MutL